MKYSKYQCFFPVKIKNAREPSSLEDVHGYFFEFMGTFKKIHGQVVAVTGTFLDVFTGTFQGFMGKKIKCSRILLMFTGYILIFNVLCSGVFLQKFEIRLTDEKSKF